MRLLLAVLACGAPDPAERCGNLLDDDGDGLVDGLDPACDTGGPAPAPEDCGNGVDDDGDFVVDCGDEDCVPTCDADRDGWDGEAVGGLDCDDHDPAVHPEAEEVPYDGAENDCDPATPDDDLDADGFPLASDCDDGSAATFPGAPETCGNGRVDDCDAGSGPAREACYGDRDAPSADAALFGPSTEDWAGQAVVGLGDADGDGHADLAVGGYGEGEDSTGAVWIVRGPVSGIVDLGVQAHAKWVGESEDDWAGYTLAGGGDLTGSGLPDLLVGARYDDATGHNAGAAYVVPLLPEGPHVLSEAVAKIYAETEYDSLGVGLASPGDLTGDGRDDAVLGAPFNSRSAHSAGAAYVVPGPVVGPVQLSVATHVFRGEAEDDNAGCAVAGAGDLDGDGVGDLLVGACLSDRAGANAGAAYQFSAVAPGEWSLREADGAMVGRAAQDQLGTALAGCDLDRDGYADAVVGAPFSDLAAPDAGVVFVARGPATTEMNRPDAGLLGEAEGDHAGASVACPGDVDGDGGDDLLVGGPGHDEGGEDAGAAWLVFGPVSGQVPLADADARIVGRDAYAFVGQAVAAAGDVDGDGAPDLAIGAPFHDGLAPSGGAVWVFTFGL